VGECSGASASSRDAVVVWDSGLGLVLCAGDGVFGGGVFACSGLESRSRERAELSCTCGTCGDAVVSDAKRFTAAAEGKINNDHIFMITHCKSAHLFPYQRCQRSEAEEVDLLMGWGPLSGSSPELAQDVRCRTRLPVSERVLHPL